MADDGVNAPAAGRWLGTGAALLVAVRVAAVLSTAGVTVAVARLLGPSLSGDYALMVALVVALTTLCGLGIDSGVVWLLSRREWGASSAFLTTQLAAAPLGAVGAGAGLGLYLITREDAFGGIDAAAAIVALASVPLSVGWLYAAQVALARGEYGRTAAIRAAFPALSLVLVPPLAAAFELTGAVAGVLGANAGAWILAVGLRPPSEPRGARVDLDRLRAAVRFGIRPYLANTLGFVIFRFDFFVLSAAAGSAEVGFYAAAVAMANLLTLAPGGLGGALFPRLAARSASEPDRGLEARGIRHAVLAVLATAPLLAAGIALLLEPLFGSRFAPAVTPALILVPGTAALGVAAALYSILLGRGRPDLTLRAAVIVAPLAMALYLALIPPLEAEGAAIASTISYLASAAVAGRYVRALTRLPVRDLVLPRHSDLVDYREAARRFAAFVRGRRDEGGG